MGHPRGGGGATGGGGSGGGNGRAHVRSRPGEGVGEASKVSRNYSFFSSYTS